jgi:hypothetical protein
LNRDVLQVHDNRRRRTRAAHRIADDKTPELTGAVEDESPAVQSDGAARLNGRQIRGR